jgi:hypothetical protein
MNLKTRLLCCVVGVLAWAPTASAAVSFTVQFDDPAGTYSAYYSAIQSNLIAAGNDWARRFDTTANASINLIVRFDGRPTMAASSLTSSYVSTVNGIPMYEQGAAYEARTGIDPNGTTPDAEVIIGTSHLQNELWFDPSPTTRNTTPVPSNKTDAYSNFVHELAHAFVFAGWRNPTTGALPGNYMSTFDRYMNVSTSPFYFVGPYAQSSYGYGQAVPLTIGNPTHLGNNSPQPGSNLNTDVLFGPAVYRGYRYYISKTDRAVFQDCGIPIKAACFTTGC